MRADLRGVAWADLRHVYADPEEIPDLIEAIARGDGGQERCADLAQHLSHQGTVYEAAARRAAASLPDSTVDLVDATLAAATNVTMAADRWAQLEDEACWALEDLGAFDDWSR